MRMTQVEVVYSYTYNLGNYSNVRPSIKLTAELAEGDNEAEVRRELMESARHQAEAEIDRALEQQGSVPKFYPGPRYSLLLVTADRLAVLARKDERDELPDPWPKVFERYLGHRKEYILARYAEEWSEFTLIEPVNGDYSGLPKIAHLTSVSHEEKKLWVLLPGDIGRHDIAEVRGEGWWDAYGSGRSYRLPEARLAEAQEEAKAQGYEFIDASDGDLEKLPYLEREPVEAEGDEWEYDPLDDDGDEDEWD